MSPTQRYYRMVFIRMALPFGLMMIPVMALSAYVGAEVGGDHTPLDDSSGILILAAGAVVTGLLSGVMYGALMTWILGRKHVNAVRALVGEPTDDDLRVAQSRELSVSLEPGEAFARAARAVREIPRVTVVTEDAAAGVLEVKAGRTAKSWGEQISVRVRAGASGMSIVAVSSRPTLRRTIADYATNLDHVRRVEEALRD